MSYTRDWSASREHWPDLFAPHAGQPELRFLEIGCYEGQATVWLLENILTAPTSQVTVIDPFPMDGQLARFRANVQPHRARVRVKVGRSENRLPQMTASHRLAGHVVPHFDVIYIDGSHYPADVLLDATLGWRLLKPGGLMLFDDYDWPDAPNGQDVRSAVDAFVAVMGCYGKPVGRDQYLVSK